MSGSTIFRIVLALGGAYVAFSAYNGTSVIPNVIPLIDVVDETFPTIPNDPQVLSILNKYDTVVTNRTDALVLARACRDFGVLIGRDELLKNLGQFDQARVNSFRSLLLNTQMEGKYKGALNVPMKELYNYMFSYLKTNDGISSVELDARARRAVVDYYNALSWKFAQIAGGK
jgi:hypothetical protein